MKMYFNCTRPSGRRLV